MTAKLVKAFETETPFVFGETYKARALYNIGNGVLSYWVQDKEGNQHDMTQRQFEMHFHATVK